MTPRETATDCAILGAGTLLPVISYVHRLGFYADDWGFLGRSQENHDHTIVEYVRTFYSFPRTRSRPVMEIYEALLLRAFGTHPLGYHVVNTIVFFASALLLYLILRWVLRDRLVSVAVALIFVLLPNYSGARFVPCAFMIGLSMALFLLNLYAMLRAARTATLSWAWTATSVGAALISGLAYEVALPMFALNWLVVWGLERRKPPAERLPLPSLSSLLLASNGVALLSVLLFKMFTTVRYHGLASPRDIAGGAVAIHFYKLGLRLPVVAAKALLVYWNPALFVIALAFGVALAFYFSRIQRAPEHQSTSVRMGTGMIVFGLIAFAFGHAIFLVSAKETGFSATGFESRTAIGASLGIAFIFAGVVICIGTLFKSHQRLALSLLITMLCTCELLATGTIGAFWAAAADRQAAVLNSLQHDFPTLPQHSVLLLDGVCPYVGPGIVFEGASDVGGALQLRYQDSTLRGDVVTSRLKVHADEIETRVYAHVRYYPYGPNLKVYDFRRKRLWSLTDFAAAREYFGILGPAHSFCPEGSEGEGVAIF